MFYIVISIIILFRSMKTLLSSTLDLQGALGVDGQPAGITKGQVRDYTEGCHRQAANVTSIHTPPARFRRDEGLCPPTKESRGLISP